MDQTCIFLSFKHTKENQTHTLMWHFKSQAIQNKIRGHLLSLPILSPSLALRNAPTGCISGYKFKFCLGNWDEKTAIQRVSQQIFMEDRVGYVLYYFFLPYPKVQDHLFTKKVLDHKHYSIQIQNLMSIWHSCCIQSHKMHFKAHSPKF